MYSIMASASGTNLMRPKVIVFDLLTALLDSWSVWDVSAVAACSQEQKKEKELLGVATEAAISYTEAEERDVDRQQKQQDLTLHLGYRWRCKYLELTYSCGAYRPYLEMALQAARETTGLAEDHQGATDRLYGNWDRLQVWDEVPRVLWTLQQQGYRLAVVTNCSDELGSRAVRVVEKAVSRYAASSSDSGARQTMIHDEEPLRFSFDALVTAEGCGYYKPHPKSYLDVLAKLGVEPPEAMFVAGSPADIPGAAAMGMRVAWHNRMGLRPLRSMEVSGHPGLWREGKTLEDALGALLIM